MSAARRRLAAAASRDRGPMAASSAAVPCLPEDRTARANMSSTMAGPMPIERAGGALLSQAAGRGAVHAGDGPAAARRAPAPTRRRARGAADRRRWQARATGIGVSSAARHLPAPSEEWQLLAAPASCSAPTSSSTGMNDGYATSTNFSARSPRASARRSARSGARRSAPASTIDMADRRRDHRGALGRLLRLLQGHRRAQMGHGPISTGAFFSPARRDAWPTRAAGPAPARRPLIAGALNFIGGDTLYGRYWGCDRGPPVPAFRDLLLPGDRLRDRAWAGPRRGRRAGRAQAGARLPAGKPLSACITCRFRPAPGRCRVSEGGALRGRRRVAGADRPRALQESGRSGGRGLTGTAQHR